MTATSETRQVKDLPLPHDCAGVVTFEKDMSPGNKDFCSEMINPVYHKLIRGFSELMQFYLFKENKRTETKIKRVIVTTLLLDESLLFPVYLSLRQR